MNAYSLTEGLYLYPTPADAYYAACSVETDKPRQFLRALLKQQQTCALNVANLQQLMGQDEEQKCMELLHHCQKLGWIQGLDAVLEYPQGALKAILPELLSKISEHGKVLLADSQGFYLVSNGFPHEVAEELSALSAEIATVHERRSGLLMNNMGLASHAWAVIDATGNSQVGFWPLFIGNKHLLIPLSCLNLCA